MSTRVYVVEDNAVMREMLVEFLGAQHDLTVAGTACTGEDALAELRDGGADVVLVDMRLPGMSGLALIERLVGEHPELPCLVLSGHGEEGYVDRALAAGARGYVLKGYPSELVDAIKTVLSGKVYESPALRRADGTS